VESRQPWGAQPTTCLGLALALPPLPHPHLDELLLLEVPLLDTIVPGATEQDVSLDSQALDAIIVWGLKVVGWANGAHHTLTQLEHLQEEGQVGGGEEWAGPGLW
jgi:hypothetical protein